MSAFPSLEAVLLEVRQCLGVLDPDVRPLKSEDKGDFADVGLSEGKHLEIAVGLVTDILGVLDLDPESNGYFMAQLLAWSNAHKHLELNTWTYSASESQIVWYLVGRSMAPAVARLLAFWSLEAPLGEGMPSGEFWFLPTVDPITGQLQLPLPKVLDWLIDLYGKPAAQLQTGLGGKATKDLDLYDSRLRTLYNWKVGVLPRANTIIEMFPDENGNSAPKDFLGAFPADPDWSDEQAFEACLAFVRKKGLAPQALARQIEFSNVERLTAVMSGQGSALEHNQFINALISRYAAPSRRIIRQRLMIARAVQDGYQRLCKFLCPDVEATCTDHSRNKVLQIVGVFTRVFNLTVYAHTAARGQGEDVENEIFSKQLTPYESMDLLISVVPQLREVAHRVVPQQWFVRFERMRPENGLEDMLPTDPSNVEEFVRKALERLVRETDEERRVDALVQRIRTSSPWRALKSESFDVVRRIVGVDGIPDRLKGLACERLMEAAGTSREKAEAAAQLAINILARGVKDRHLDAEEQVHSLLAQARAELGGGHWEPLILKAEARHLLFQGRREDALATYRRALKACSSWGCGKVRGEIALDLLALELADGPLLTQEHSKHRKYHRNIMAFGMLPDGVYSLEDTAVWVEEFFWSDLYQPYKGSKPFKRPQSVKAREDLKLLAENVLRGQKEDVTAWLAQHRKQLERAPIKDVRGDSVLTFFLKSLQKIEPLKVLPAEMVDRYRDFIRELIDAWPGQVNLTDFKAQTPLMLAADQGDEKVVRWLLAAGADVDAQDYWGRTALHAAVAGRFPACVALLLDAQPDIKNGVTQADKQSVLHTAVRFGDVAIARMIVDAFPSLLGQENAGGRTPAQEREYILECHEQFSRFMRDNNRTPPSVESLRSLAEVLAE